VFEHFRESVDATCDFLNRPFKVQARPCLCVDLRQFRPHTIPFDFEHAEGIHGPAKQVRRDFEQPCLPACDPAVQVSKPAVDSRTCSRVRQLDFLPCYFIPQSGDGVRVHEGGL
jgi:hypothetical protein